MLRYLKEAFWVRPRVPGLGNFPINLVAVAAFGVLGLANPGFWLLGLGLEAGFVSLLATNRRFQRLVDVGDRQLSRRAVEEKRSGLLKQLSKGAAERHRKLSGKCGRVIAVHANSPEAEYVAESNSQALGKLEWIYLKLLIGQQFLLSSESQADATGLHAQIAAVRRDLDTDRLTEAARESKVATLRILEKRVENLDRREQQLQEIESDLLRIEAQVDLALENATLERRPQAVSTGIDLASHLLDDASLFGTAAETIADLDASYGMTSVAVETEGG